jgi:hypothetical protein
MISQGKLGKAHICLSLVKAVVQFHGWTDLYSEQDPGLARGIAVSL